MAYEEMSFESVMEKNVPEAPFVWTEDAHSLYLTFLEEAFVNDLYLRRYCSLDICGCSPPFPSALSAAHASTVAAAESPSSAPTQLPSPELRTETTTRRRCPRSSAKVSSSKRKGKWLSQDAGFENRQTFESAIGLHDNKSFLEQPGSSSHSDYVVPKVLRRVSKRSRHKAKMDGIDRLGTDQVVPLDYEQG